MYSKCFMFGNIIVYCIFTSAEEDAAPGPAAAPVGAPAAVRQSARLRGQPPSAALGAPLAESGAEDQPPLPAVSEDRAEQEDQLPLPSLGDPPIEVQVDAPGPADQQQPDQPEDVPPEAPEPVQRSQATRTPSPQPGGSGHRLIYSI